LHKRLLIMKYFLAIALLAVANKIKITKSQFCCEGTWCPGGCCPYVGWYCCSNELYCAPTADECPSNEKKEALTKIAASKQCQGLECPGGCCPVDDWYCCPDDLYCAPTANDCPFVSKKEALTPTAAYCPFVPKKQQISKMDAKIKCSGTDCPGGCCPYYNWYCCPDGDNCAPTAAECPTAPKNLALEKCEGTWCPGGCCNYDGMYCCPDNLYCAWTPSDCP